MAVWRSKLGTQYPRDFIDKLDREHHKILKQLRAEPANAHCAECGDLDTTWASVSLGVFLCVRCADVHRALGTHISKVKGCSGTYLWGPDEIERMQSIGNAKAEKMYCGGGPRPSKGATKEERIAFCTEKYVTQARAQKVLPVTAASAMQSLPSQTEHQHSLKSFKKEQDCIMQLQVRSASKNQPSKSVCRSAAHQASVPAKIAASANTLDIDSFFDDILAFDSQPVVEPAVAENTEQSQSCMAPGNKPSRSFCRTSAHQVPANAAASANGLDSDSFFDPFDPRAVFESTLPVAGTAASANSLDIDAFFDDMLALDSQPVVTPALPEEEDAWWMTSEKQPSKSVFRASAEKSPAEIAATANTQDAVNPKPVLEQALPSAEDAGHQGVRKESDIHAFLEQCLSAEGGIAALPGARKSAVQVAPAPNKTDKLGLQDPDAWWAEFGL